MLLGGCCFLLTRYSFCSQVIILRSLERTLKINFHQEASKCLLMMVEIWTPNQRKNKRIYNQIKTYVLLFPSYWRTRTKRILANSMPESCTIKKYISHSQCSTQLQKNDCQIQQQEILHKTARNPKIMGGNRTSQIFIYVIDISLYSPRETTFLLNENNPP